MMTLPLDRHAVAKHPLFSSFKVDYLYALEYFLRKYGEGNTQARAAFKVYETKLSSHNIPYSYCGDEKALEIVRSFLGTKFDVLTVHYRCYRACLSHGYCHQTRGKIYHVKTLKVCANRINARTNKNKP